MRKNKLTYILFGKNKKTNGKKYSDMTIKLTI